MNKDFVDVLLLHMLRVGEGISDLLFTTGKSPLIELHGSLEEIPIDAPDSILSPEHIEAISSHIIDGSVRLAEDLRNFGSCDCSYELAGVARFRVNIFRQNGRQSIVMRKLSSKIPTLDELGLPPIFRQMTTEKNGIVFVCGGTGSGKTTTLAAMLNEINETQKVHVLTLEDPIEFSHSHKSAAINQRELGKDFPDFAHGLRAALRQAPKVILVGEIRDRETMETALTASETGHLVFSTLHTINAGQTINRIVGMFAREEEEQVRRRLADTLRYVVCQRLVSKDGGGRLLVTELMGSSMRTREAIIYGESESRNFQEIMEAGSTLGWHSFDQSLLQASRAGHITEEAAMTCCTNRPKMKRDLDLLRNEQNAEKADAVSGLKLQTAFEDAPTAEIRKRSGDEASLEMPLTTAASVIAA